ncbi:MULTISPECIES: flagellar protein FlaG [Hyphobacterium]|uniref:Flagellar protein FlaG n=1 Tax=Hyphobacterium vulgare TaxID=1736751 RepID=A0ABV7A087_9PROT
MIELIKLATAAATVAEKPAAAPRAIEASAAVATRNADAEAKSQDERKADIERMREAIDRLAGTALEGSRLSIQKHESSGMFVYNLVDSETGEIVRQWPQKEMVELKEYLRTRQAGLVDKRA